MKRREYTALVDASPHVHPSSYVSKAGMMSQNPLTGATEVEVVRWLRLLGLDFMVEEVEDEDITGDKLKKITMVSCRMFRARVWPRCLSPRCSCWCRRATCRPRNK